MFKPTKVSEDFLYNLLASPHKHAPMGLFYREGENGLWIACDNSTGDAVLKEFKIKQKAYNWLEASNEQYSKSKL
jgi:hypothetical protein